jgi:hypothetical protein
MIRAGKARDVAGLEGVYGGSVYRSMAKIFRR